MVWYRGLVGEGVDVAMECVGISATVQSAIECVRKGGAVGLVGNLAQRIDFPLQSVVTREISLFGSCASAGEYPAALEEIAAGRIRVEPLTSAVRPLDEGAEWFHKRPATALRGANSTVPRSSGIAWRGRSNPCSIA